MSYHWLLMMPDYRRSVRSPVSVKSWYSPEFIYIFIFDLEQYLQCNQPPTINHIYQDILWSLHSETERFISTTQNYGTESFCHKTAIESRQNMKEQAITVIQRKQRPGEDLGVKAVSSLEILHYKTPGLCVDQSSSFAVRSCDLITWPCLANRLKAETRHMLFLNINSICHNLPRPSILTKFT